MAIIRILSIFCLFYMFPIWGGAQYTHYDGPYIFAQKDSLLIQWVASGKARDTTIHKDQSYFFSIPFLPEVDLTKLDIPKQKEGRFEVEKLAVISDVHGQYEVMMNLLKRHNVINNQGKWKYGNGHVVVVGDNMDRGNKVLDILWFLFRLEKEALQAGGRLHLLLGNHELMVLNGDLRYIHKKYRYTSGAFLTPYYKFFRESSILGDWLAKQKIAVIVNDKLFVHGGFSPDLANIDLPIEELNKTFSKEILRQPEEDIAKDKLYAYLYQSKGPLWYRGYFGTERISEAEVDAILDKFKVEKIVVGHTTQNAILSLYDNKVIVVDCGIKFGETGQILIEEEGELLIGNYDGSVEELIKSRKSIFQYIYELSDKPILHLTTDVGHIIKHRRKEEYQDVNFELFDQAGKRLLDLPAEIRTRGNVRKTVCRYPPFKIDFKKSTLDSIGMQKNDKLKLVLPCKKGKSYQQRLYKEYFLYDLYRLIDTNGIEAKLVEIHMNTEEKEKYVFDGFFVEDEGAYEIRKKARVITQGKVVTSVIDQENFHKLVLFQYMIANTDWAVANKHNLELVMVDQTQKIFALPYDFDYCGLVGQPYAIPGEGLPIQSIHQRYFFSYKVSKNRILATIKFFQDKKDEIMELCDKASYMSKGSRSEIKRYIEEFYSTLEHPKRLLRQLTFD